MSALPYSGSSAAVDLAPIWRISVERYHDMIERGVLGPDDPIELLEGVLVEKMSKNPAHRIATGLTRRALEAIVPAGWYVETQEPITLSDSEPEPDVAVIRGETRDYRDRHPGAADVALVIEIADAALTRDRIVKKRIYARAGIPAYWIVDLTSGTLEVWTEPVDDAYLHRETYRRGQHAATPFGEVDVSQLLP